MEEEGETLASYDSITSYDSKASYDSTLSSSDSSYFDRYPIELTALKKYEFESPVQLKKYDKPTVSYKILKKYENELVECFDGVNLSSLARLAAENGVLGKDVKDNVESIHSTVPRSLVCRYIFYCVYPHVSNDSKKFESWQTVLSKFKETAVLIYKIKKCQCEVVSDPDSVMHADNESEVVLRESHVSDLVEVLANCTSKWKEIGTALGLLQNEIDNIFAVNLHSPVMCLTKVISAWVMGKCLTAKPPSIANLKNALESRTVGLGAEASMLEEKIIKQLGKSKCDASKDQPIIAFEIISQTLDQNINIAEATAILLEVRVTALVSSEWFRFVTFEWFRDGTKIHKENSTGYNNEYIGILFVRLEDLTAEGTYTCNVTNHPDEVTLTSKPIVITITTPLDKYTKNLVDFYTAQSEVPEDTWPPVSSNTYISLALIKQDSIHHAGEFGRVTIRGDADDIYSNKEYLMYEKAFDGLEGGMRLLVEGRPGSGKTTLVHKVSQDWAKDILKFKHVRLLFLVHLRAFCSNPEIDLFDILNCYFRSSSIKEEIGEYAEKHSGLGFCFILDGLDEYLPSSSDVYIYKLINKLALPKSLVITASRPAAAAKFRSAASRQVEVIGFLKQQISDYINNYPFSGLKKCEKLRVYLEQHPNVHHMCYLPIHAAMVCFLFDRVDTELPQTETEIYKLFTKFTILRILYRHDGESQIYMNSIEDLPQSKKEVYSKICNLAYEMCISSKQVMTQSEAQTIFCARDDNDSLGLVTLDKMAMLCGFQQMYTFLHLTFQEFLAAYHIANQEQNKQFELIVEMAEAKQMQQVFKFYCGLAEFGTGCQKFKALMDRTVHDSLYKVQCAFESQQSHVCDIVTKDNCLSFSDNFLSPSNFTEIAFVLLNAHKNFVTRISFEGCVFERECIEILYTMAKDKLSLVTTFCFQRCNDQQQLDLVSYFLQFLPSVETLDISESEFGMDGIDPLTKNLDQSNIQVLRVGGRGSELYSSPEVLQKLFDTFKSKCGEHFNIQFAGVGKSMAGNINDLPNYFHFDYPELDLTTVKLSQAGFRSLSWDLQRFPYFTRLALNDCGIDNDIASCLALGLKHCRDLEILELAFNTIGDYGAVAIGNSLSASTKLGKLDFTKNHLSARGTLELALLFKSSSVELLCGFNNIKDDSSYADTLQTNKNVEFHTLNAPNRKFGEPGVDWLISTIHSSCNFNDILQLQLPMNSFTHRGIESLSSVLAQCSNLLKLDLSSNNLGVDRARILSGALKHCTKLHNLDLSFNQLGKDGAKEIAGGLSCCTNLLQLKINSNNIRGEGMRYLAEALQSCAILQELEVNKNMIEYQGVKALAHTLNSKCWAHFYVLDIRSNGISTEGIKILAEAIAQFTTLQELYISNNDLQNEGTEFLAYSLRSLTNIQVLDICGADLQKSSNAQSLVDSLQYNTSLCSLNISKSNLGKEGAKALGKAVQHWPKISKLNISHNEMTSYGAECLAQSLTHINSSNLTKLDLSNNSISENNAILGDALKLFIHLEELNISNNLVRISFLQALAESLVHWRNIHVLNASCTGIGEVGAQVFSRGLMHCSQLRELYLSKNQLFEKGACAIAGSFMAMKKLQTIDISSNDISTFGMSMFIRELNVDTPSIRELNISNNKIEDKGVEELTKIVKFIQVLIASNVNLRQKGAETLATGLKECINLQSLDVSLNHIGEGIEALFRALKCCTTLQSLDVGMDYSSSSIKAACEEVLRANSSLCAQSSVPPWASTEQRDLSEQSPLLQLGPLLKYRYSNKQARQAP